MGLWDSIKDAAGDVGGYVADIPSKPLSTVGDALNVSTWVPRQGLKWGWNNTVGEWGDRDYDPNRDTSAAQALQTQQAEDIQNRFLNPEAPGPLDQAALDWAAQNNRFYDPNQGQLRAANSLTQLRQLENPYAIPMSLWCR